MPLSYYDALILMIKLLCRKSVPITQIVVQAILVYVRFISKYKLQNHTIAAWVQCDHVY
jgi:hypothetical protein